MTPVIPVSVVGGCMMRLPIFALACAFAACAATGTRYSQDERSWLEVPAHLSRVTVFRTDSGTQYSGRSADLKIDGRARGSVKYKGFPTIDVPPGAHVLRVDLCDSPGAGDLSIHVTRGDTNFYEVIPTPENWLASLAGVLAASSASAGAAAGPIGTNAAMSAESSGKVCGGAFSIVPVDDEPAQSKLVGLRSSE